MISPLRAEEVNFTLPEVLCLDGNDLGRIVDMPEMQPRFITDDSKNRRFMYLSDIRRNTDENSFEGPKDEFLSTLGWYSPSELQAKTICRGPKS